jgi:hypothetical protein
MEDIYQPMTWQFVILRDRDDRVHLGALVAGAPSTHAEYFDLVAPLGAPQADTRQLATDLVAVTDELLGDLQGLVERCVDDERLRAGLNELFELQQLVSVSRIDLADAA